VCLTHFKVLKRRTGMDEETEEKVRQKEVRREGRRNVRRKGWTSDNKRMENGRKTQKSKKEIKRAGNKFAHMRCTPIVFRFVTLKT
jgi:hypothetical protein